MDAREAQLKGKFEFHLKQATELAAQLQAIEQLPGPLVTKVEPDCESPS